MSLLGSSVSRCLGRPHAATNITSQRIIRGIQGHITHKRTSRRWTQGLVAARRRILHWLPKKWWTTHLNNHATWMRFSIHIWKTQSFQLKVFVHMHMKQHVRLAYNQYTMQQVLLWFEKLTHSTHKSTKHVQTTLHRQKDTNYHSFIHSFTPVTRVRSLSPHSTITNTTNPKDTRHANRATYHQI